MRSRSGPSVAPALPGRWRRAVAATFVLALLALASPASGQGTHLVVVSGLGGSAEYSARFADWGSRLVAAAVSAGVPRSDVVWLAEGEDVAPGVSGVSRKERVAAEIAGLVERTSSDDLVVLVLFGHGSARNGESRINLPGPDLSAGELGVLLAPLAPRRLVVVNAASASGGFIAPLSAPGRVVITATRSPVEAEAARFGGFFVDALAGSGADTDKDGRVSILEAFEYARREVSRSFAGGGHLPTEHALLDDDGDGRGSLEPGGGDGALAAGLWLDPIAASTGGGDPAVAGLRAEQARLEAALVSLRGRRTAMTPAAYEAELERLLLEIARTGRALREAQDASGGTDPGASAGGGFP